MEDENNYMSVSHTLTELKRALARSVFDTRLMTLSNDAVIGDGTTDNCIIGAHLRSLLGEKDQKSTILGREFFVGFEEITIAYSESEASEREKLGYEIVYHFEFPLPPYASYLSSRNYRGHKITAEDVRYYLQEFDAISG